MSKESYARGFCKAAAAAGVDPVALAKYAQDYEGAGIGSLADNFGELVREAFADGTKHKDPSRLQYYREKPHFAAYSTMLAKNNPVGQSLLDLTDQNFYNQYLPITQKELESSRDAVAREMSGKIFPKGTAQQIALYRNLMRAGEQNQKSYINTGSVVPRKELDRTGIENTKFPDIPEKDREKMKSKGINSMEDWIKILQNSIGRGREKRITGNVA